LFIITKVLSRKVQ